MRVAIMQPYFLPYIGYWQLINAVDKFIIYDNIKYTKKGWINRNRFLSNSRDSVFSLPLKKDSDLKNIVEREISPEFNPCKLINQFKGAYEKSPYFDECLPLLRSIIHYNEKNLFKFIYNSVIVICSYLQISTEILISSNINIQNSLNGKERVIALCKEIGATTYINPIGGTDLYCKKEFENYGINLSFLKSKPVIYYQFDKQFIPFLSVIDLLMFNSHKKVCEIARKEFFLC
jgi:hypothetical protein